MENQTIAFPNPIFLPADHAGMADRGQDYTSMRRELIRLLNFTIDSLCEGSEYTERDHRNIRSMITSLSAVQRLTGKNESHPDDVPVRNFVDDLNGTRYVAIRSCELERFSEK
jgi:hypothetical protein